MLGSMKRSAIESALLLLGKSFDHAVLWFFLCLLNVNNMCLSILWRLYSIMKYEWLILPGPLLRYKGKIFWDARLFGSQLAPNPSDYSNHPIAACSVTHFAVSGLQLFRLIVGEHPFLSPLFSETKSVILHDLAAFTSLPNSAPLKISRFLLVHSCFISDSDPKRQEGAVTW